VPGRAVVEGRQDVEVIGDLVERPRELGAELVGERRLLT
jgi:hypothetical protein